MLIHHPKWAESYDVDGGLSAITPDLRIHFRAGDGGYPIGDFGRWEPLIRAERERRAARAARLKKARSVQRRPEPPPGPTPPYIALARQRDLITAYVAASPAERREIALHMDPRDRQAAIAASTADVASVVVPSTWSPVRSLLSRTAAGAAVYMAAERRVALRDAAGRRRETPLEAAIADTMDSLAALRRRMQSGDYGEHVAKWPPQGPVEMGRFAQTFRALPARAGNRRRDLECLQRLRAVPAAVAARSTWDLVRVILAGGYWWHHIADHELERRLDV